MPSLEILKAGLMTSIQDLGRKGLAYYAIPTSGVMDPNAAKIALLLLNQPEVSPLIECTSIAPHIRFHHSTRIVLTGADFQWTLNDQPILLNTVIEVHQGDLLRGRFAQTGLRGYLALEGKIVLEPVYGSYSTYLNAKIGGVKGRLLQKGDVIEWKDSNPSPGSQPVIPLRTGPEFQYLAPHAQHQLTSQMYTIGTDSSRMGIRLRGEPLESSTYQLACSAPVLPGFMQLPPSGMPIILLQDGQISGGYPRIAYVPELHLSRLNQIPLGAHVKFELE